MGVACPIWVPRPVKCPQQGTKCPQMCPLLLILILPVLVQIYIPVPLLTLQILVQLVYFQVELYNLQDLDQNPEQMLVRLVLILISLSQ